ncbi:hypothetical protein NEIRO03_2354 [Nematocida sp. AWRm78]|nr:hypothetical protein NEIRO02_2334 [Nematocida sp. AWRm79]KAI5186690.1 hypothetical protein NEIRO03_2354 [Nematocida sp. AWRm78]
MEKWIPPKRLTGSSAAELNILPSYPVNISNNIHNITHNVPLINTTRHNFIPKINYKALLDNEIVAEISHLINNLEETK